MIEIKTAQAWGALTPDGRVYPLAISTKDGRYKQQIVIVHGQTEAEVHEAAALLENSREVCEYTEVGTKIVGCVELPYYDEPEYCPSCGRKVVVK